MNFIRLLILSLRRWWFIRRGVHCHPQTIIRQGVSLRPGTVNGRPGKIVLKSSSELETGTILHAWGGSIEIDENVFIGPQTVIYGQGSVKIGRDTLVAMHCRILSSEHTLSPVGTPIRSQPDILKPTVIGEDVWIGAGVTVLGGVTLGDHSVIGAGSVVTGDIPAGAIAFGSPARVKGERSDV